MRRFKTERASITHIIVVERGCGWAKRAALLASYMRADVVVQPPWEESSAFVRRALNAIRSRPKGIVRVVLVGNGSWDAHALGARSTIVRAAIAEVGVTPDAEIVLCAELDADERTFARMKAFVASLRELAGAAVRIRCVREIPVAAPHRTDGLAYAA